MLETFDAIFSVEPAAVYVIAGLTIACALMFWKMTDSVALTALFAPIAAFGALLGIYVSSELGLYYSAETNSNIILSSLLGLLVSLVLVMLVARICFTLTNAFRRGQMDKLQRR